MKIEESTLTLEGYQLHRLILTPEDTMKGTLIFFHGQGDFIDRYPPLLRLFVKRGWECILTDLPGHGRSAGKRGHVPSLQFIDRIIDDLPVTEKMAVCGHSMGGMLALRELMRRPERYAMGWFSSPLLAPAHQASPLMKVTLPIIAGLFPWLTRSTGVRAEDCTPEDRKEHPEIKPLYHGNISLGWARELFQTAENLDAQWLNLPKKTPLLFTQGKADRVCPASILRERLGKLDDSQIEYREIPNALHEPFTGETAKEFYQVLDQALTKLA